MITEGFQPRISDDMNASLTSQVTRDEYNKLYFQFILTKLLDGMSFTALFFQRYWHILSDDVRLSFHFFDSEEMKRCSNHTLIALNPKVKQVKAMRDLQPNQVVQGSVIKLFQRSSPKGYNL